MDEPKQIKVSTPHYRGYRSAQPIPAILDYVDSSGLYVISDDLFYEYGYGETAADAERDYLDALVGHYETLAQWATPKNKPTQIQFAKLREYFIKDTPSTS